MQVTRLLTVLLVSFYFSTTTSAQVNGPGPSDPGLFDTVINLPGDPVFGDDLADIQSIGNEDGSADPTTQINVWDGGTVRVLPNFEALSGAEFNISGGTVSGGLFNVGRGGEFNISGGTVIPLLQARSGSRVTIRGGIVTRLNNVGGNTELIGGEFSLNGVAFTDPKITVLSEDVFTGTLEDGTAFIYSQETFDNVFNATLTQATSLPTADLTPQFVSTDISAGTASGLRVGQTLTLQNGGILGNNFAVVDATLNIDGGTASSLKIARSTVNISGGDVGTGGFIRFDVLAGSTVNVSGGSVFNARFTTHSGSTVNISAGSVGGSIS